MCPEKTKLKRARSRDVSWCGEEPEDTSSPAVHVVEAVSVPPDRSGVSGDFVVQDVPSACAVAGHGPCDKKQPVGWAPHKLASHTKSEKGVSCEKSQTSAWYRQS